MDPEILFNVDLVYIRYALSFALARSVKDNIGTLRNSVNDLGSRGDMIKQTLDRLLPSTHKVFKLSKFHNLVFQGLQDSTRIHELNPQTAFNIDLFMRINLASALILKTFSNQLNPDKFLFLSSVCKITLENIIRLRSAFNFAFNKLFENIKAFLEIAEYFYRCIMIYVAIKLNMYEDKGLIKRTKDFKLNYVENQVLAKELIRLVNELEKKSWKGTDAFNVENNRVFAVAFFRKFSIEDAEQCVN